MPEPSSHQLGEELVKLPADLAGKVQWFNEAPAHEVHQAVKRRPAQRGPQKAPTKVRISIRLSSEVIEAFKATGDGWQTRVDEVLRDYVAKHR